MNDHLTIDEMIDFVSITKTDDASIKLAAKVNAHTIRCPECRRKVRAFYDVHTALFEKALVSDKATSKDSKGYSRHDGKNTADINDGDNEEGSTKLKEKH